MITSLPAKCTVLSLCKAVAFCPFLLSYPLRYTFPGQLHGAPPCDTDVFLQWNLCLHFQLFCHKKNLRFLPIYIRMNNTGHQYQPSKVYNTTKMRSYDFFDQLDPRIHSTPPNHQLPCPFLTRNVYLFISCFCSDSFSHVCIENQLQITCP